MPKIETIVDVTGRDYERAVQLATATLAKFANISGHYNNTFNSHLRGKIGEIACAKWLLSRGLDVEPLFEDPDELSAADLIVKNKRHGRIEVKSWDERWWSKLGRCIAVNQLSNLRAKADLVVWCVCPTKIEPGISVRLKGFSLISDIANAPRRNTGPVNARQVFNHQLNDDQLRDMDLLYKSS